jgi:guanine deaminase
MDDPRQCPAYYRDGTPDDAVRETREIIEFIRGMPGNGPPSDGEATPTADASPPRVLPVITPRFIPSCTDALLMGLGVLAAETGCHVQTHCSESDWEHAFALERFGCTDTEALNRFGLLTRRTILGRECLR